MNFLDKILILFLTVVVVLAFPLVLMFNMAMGLATVVKTRYTERRITP